MVGTRRPFAGTASGSRDRRPWIIHPLLSGAQREILWGGAAVHCGGSFPTEQDSSGDGSYAPFQGRKAAPSRHTKDLALGMDSQIQLGGRILPYQIRRSARRRTIAISIDPKEGLVVYSPLRVNVEGLQEFLQEKARWILRHAERLEAARDRNPTLTWEHGGNIPYRGGQVQLRVEPGAARFAVHLAGEILTVQTPPEAGLVPDAESVRVPVVRWLRGQAAAEVEARVRVYQEQVNAVPRTIRVRDQKRRWGSCSAHGALNFNWRLILAPAEVLDYVVVHELCHLKELNHSTRFWEWVGRVLPDYRDPRGWLRHNGHLLDI